MTKNLMKSELEAMMPEQIVAQVRAILDPGPWQVVTNHVVQGYALWEVQGKLDKPWTQGRRRKGARQCTACGAIFGGVTGFAQHRAGMRCHDPVDLGLSRAEDGVWRQPVPVFRDGVGDLATQAPGSGNGPLPRARAIARRLLRQITVEDVARLSQECGGCALPPTEAREMDALLRQQAMDRIRERGWSYAGQNKVLGKLAALAPGEA